MAKMGPVRSRLKAPGTLKGKKMSAQRKWKTCIDRKKQQKLEGFLLSVAFGSYIGFHFSIFEYHSKELFETD